MIDLTTIAPGEEVDITDLRQAYRLWKILENVPLVDAADKEEREMKGLENCVIVPSHLFQAIVRLIFEHQDGLMKPRWPPPLPKDPNALP